MRDLGLISNFSKHYTFRELVNHPKRGIKGDKVKEQKKRKK
jgi:hypothetical protein